MKPVARITSAAAFLALVGTALGGDLSASGLVVLDPSADGALSMVGNSCVEIPARIVYVNSRSSRAISTRGSATLDAPQVDVVGGASFRGESNCTGVIREGMAPCVDPYENLMFPNADAAAHQHAVALSGGSNTTIQPGFYSSISVAGNSTLHFEPGVYFIGDGGFQVTSGNVFGEGVSIIMLQGSLDLTGSAIMQLSPPSSGSMAGIVISQPRENEHEVRIAGGRDVVISGTLYAPGATIVLTGNATMTGEGPQMGDIVVANRVELAGTGTIKIGGPETKPIKLPSQPLFD